VSGASSRRAGSWERWAKLGIMVLFAALVRNAAEYFRLKAVRGTPAPAVYEPYLLGALVTAISAWLAVTGFFFGRYRLAVGLAIGTVILLLVLKAWLVR
jgi:hypothetical protein